MRLQHLVRMLIACVLATTAASANAAEPMWPVLTGPIVDAVDEIPADRQAALDARLRDFKRRTGHHLQIAIVADLQGMDVERYANGLFRHWKLGRAGVNDGILLVHSPKDRKVRIEVGYGAEPYLTDALSSRIMRDDIIPAFKQDRFADGIEAGAVSIMREASITPEQRAEDERKAALERARAAQRARDAFATFIWWVVAIAAVAALGFGIWMLATRKRRAERRAAELRAREERRRAEAAAAAARAEARRRLAEAARVREAAALKARQDMLDAMTPTARAAFLDEERRAADRARRIAAAEEVRRRARREAEERAEEQRREERRRRERRDSSAGYGGGIVYGGSSSASSSDSGSGGSSWSGDGGSSGGGGATGDY